MLHSTVTYLLIYVLINATTCVNFDVLESENVIRCYLL